MRRTFIAVVAALALAACVPGAARAATRVALVIGNDRYETLPALNNAGKDARDMAAKLKALGFEVILRTNAGTRDLGRALSAFEGGLAGAEAGLVYYAGHGVQADGRNYLIPSDAKIEEEADLRFAGIDAAEFLATMGRAGVPVAIVVLDACRDNPLPRRGRSAARGLTSVEVPRAVKGAAILYSAGPGESAADGAKGGNGVFTAALLAALDKPGLTVEQVFKETARRVSAETGGRQTPWNNSSLTGDFYFRAGAAASAPSSGPDAEVVFWQSIPGGANVAMYEEYLRTYPNGQFAGLARLKIEELKRSQTAFVAPRPQPAVGPYRTPGTVFRDCAECPEMVVIPAGSFEMGSNGVEESQKPVHRVDIRYAFAVGKYEVTQGEWRALMGNNPSHFPGDRNPVETVNWNDAQEYVRKLSAKTGQEYRLPSEAEWEYAARAGTRTRWSCGDTESCLSAVAVYVANSGNRTAAVGGKTANGFGLHDMHGNVWEWVEDCYHDGYQGAPTDGSAWTTYGCQLRGNRGGSWFYPPGPLRSAFRSVLDTGFRDKGLGFRVARSLAGTP